MATQAWVVNLKRLFRSRPMRMSRFLTNNTFYHESVITLFPMVKLQARVLYVTSGGSKNVFHGYALDLERYTMMKLTQRIHPFLIANTGPLISKSRSNMSEGILHIGVDDKNISLMRYAPRSILSLSSCNVTKLVSFVSNIREIYSNYGKKMVGSYSMDQPRLTTKLSRR